MENNPLRNIDPDGMDSEDDIAIAGDGGKKPNPKPIPLHEVVVTAKRTVHHQSSIPLLIPLGGSTLLRLPYAYMSAAAGTTLTFVGALLLPANWQDRWHRDEIPQHCVLLTLDKILTDAVFRRETGGKSGKGKTKLYDKPGDGMDQAEKDFDSLNPQGVGDIPGGRVGTLPNGDKVNVRDHSSDSDAPTLEVQHPDGSKTKIRYGN